MDGQVGLANVNRTETLLRGVLRGEVGGSMTHNNVIPIRITPKRQGVLEQELRNTLKRHALMAALWNTVITLNAIAREAQDEADERAAVLAMIGHENEAAND